MSQLRRKQFEKVVEADVLIVVFWDKKILNEDHIQILGQDLFDLVSEKEEKIPLKLVLDFSSVEYMSAGFLGKLITLQKKVAGNAGRLIFCCMGKDVYDTLEVTKLDKFFTFFKTREDALMSLR